MDWLTFFWLVIAFYAGMAGGIWFAGLGNAARDEDPYREPWS